VRREVHSFGWSGEFGAVVGDEYAGQLLTARRDESKVLGRHGCEVGGLVVHACSWHKEHAVLGGRVEARPRPALLAWQPRRILEFVPAWPDPANRFVRRPPSCRMRSGRSRRLGDDTWAAAAAAPRPSSWSRRSCPPAASSRSKSRLVRWLASASRVGGGFPQARGRVRRLPAILMLMGAVDGMTFTEATAVIGCSPEAVRDYVLAGRLLAIRTDQGPMLYQGEVEQLARQIYGWQSHLQDEESYWLAGQRAADVLGLNRARLNQPQIGASYRTRHPSTAPGCINESSSRLWQMPGRQGDGRWSCSTKRCVSAPDR
jgi:hypothetical protein